MRPDLPGNNISRQKMDRTLHGLINPSPVDLQVRLRSIETPSHVTRNRQIIPTPVSLRLTPSPGLIVGRQFKRERYTISCVFLCLDRESATLFHQSETGQARHWHRHAHTHTHTSALRSNALSICRNAINSASHSV